MEDGSDISDEVRTLLTQQLDSVVQLELLLLMHSRPAQSWSAEDVARDLRIEPNSAAKQLAQLRDRGFLRQDEQDAGRFRYAPASPRVDAVVNELASTYQSRRVTVISLLYSRPTDTLRSFADAFRIFRKEKDDG